MRKLSIIILALLGTFNAFSQQDPHYTMYMYNMNVINPAYAGSNKTLNATFLTRQQWVGVKGSPSTYTANFHSYLAKNVGGGLSVISDQIGPSSETNVFADVAYHVKLSEISNLSFGIKLGGTFFSLNPDLLANDSESVLNNGFNEFFPNFGGGVLYHTQKFYVGASMPNLLNSKHVDRNTSGEVATEKEHLFVTGGYVFDISDYLKLKPSGLTKLVPGSPISIDLSLNAFLHDTFEVGVSHRFDDAWALMFNVFINNKIRIGYAYDRTLSDLGDFNRGSHELLFLYTLNLGDRKLKSPRYF